MARNVTFWTISFVVVQSRPQSYDVQGFQMGIEELRFKKSEVYGIDYVITGNA